MFSERSASNKNALKTNGYKMLRPRQLFCSKSELNTNERGDFPSPPPKVAATLCKAGGRVEGGLSYIYDLRWRCSQTQAIREPRGKMSGASETLPQEERQSHLQVHKRQSKILGRSQVS